MHSYVGYCWKFFQWNTLLQDRQSGLAWFVLAMIIRKWWTRLISTSHIFLSRLYIYVMSCGRRPLFCKVYEVHVQLKDYDWRLVSKEVTSRSRKFWTCLMLFCLSFCLWTLGVMVAAMYTYLQVTPPIFNGNMSVNQCIYAKISMSKLYIHVLNLK